MEAIFRKILNFFGKIKSLLNKRESSIRHRLDIRDTDGDGAIDQIVIDLVTDQSSNSNDLGGNNND